MHYPLKFSDDCHYGGEIVESTEKNDKNTPKPKMLKLLPNQIKGRGPGINSSQSKNVGKIQLSMQLPHLSIIFENIWF